MREPQVATTGAPRPVDGAVLHELLEAHFPELKSFVRTKADAFLLARESPSDITQSTCREMIQHAGLMEWRGDQAFMGYLYTTALRKIIDKRRYYRRKKREAGLEVELSGPVARAVDDGSQVPLSAPSTPSMLVIRDEDLESLQRAMAQLDEGQRRILSMRRIFGLSAKQIGAELGITTKTVRCRLARAMSRLSTLMGATDQQA